MNDTRKRIRDLIDAVSLDTFHYISKALFQADRLTFLFLMTIRVKNSF